MPYVRQLQQTDLAFIFKEEIIVAGIGATDSSVNRYFVS